jgi:hypothetical protein
MANETKTGKTKIAKLDELEFSGLDIKATTPEGQSIEAGIQPNSIQFRINNPKSTDSRKWAPARIAKYASVTILSVFLTSMTLRYVDDLRESAILEVKKTVAHVHGRSAGKLLIPVLSQVSLALKAHRPRSSARPIESISQIQDVPCATYISESISRKIKSKLTVDEQVQVVNCQLFQDSIEGARLSLDKIGFKVSELSWATMYPNLLSLYVLRRLNPLQPLGVLPKQSCLRWAPAPECLMRYVDESQLGFKSRWEDGFKMLERAMGEQGPEVNAWFYLASGAYANRDFKYERAKEFFKIAHAKVKEISNPFLQREIYRNAVINAYLSADSALMVHAETFRPTARVEEDANAFLDVDVLSKLRGPQGPDALRKYFQAPEALKRFAHDSRLLGILFRESQILKVSEGSIAFASAALGRDLRPEVLGESLIMQYVRLQVFHNNASEALAILERLEGAGYRTSELYHLKGLARLYSNKNSSTLMAAKEFQTAASLSKNEESLFALTVALLASKQSSKAEQVLQRWRTLGLAAQKTTWFYFAEGLVLALAGHKDEAMTAWDRGKKRGQYGGMWSSLKTNFAKDSSFFERDLVGNLRSIMQVDAPLGSLALSGHKP